METAQSSTGTISCPRCQTANAPVARFCSLCGQTLQGGATPPPPQPPPPPPPVNRGVFLGGGAAGMPIPFDGDIQSAFAAAIQGIQAAGGNVTWQAAPQSARFELMKKDIWNTGGMKIRYDGELAVAAQGPRQSMLRLSLKANSSSLMPMVMLNLIATLMLAVMSGPAGGMILLLGIACGAWQVYNVSNRLPGELSEKILRGLGSLPMAGAPFAGVPPQAPPQPHYSAPNGFQNGQPAGPAGGGAVPNAVEQLKQLAELRNVGAITPEEFEAKKAELLARL